MPHSFGYRARTRSLFQRPFRGHGGVHLSTYLTTYKKGDYVDIKANGAVHKGMPHRFYHGKTGIVWNVSPRAIGVELNKRVGNRILKKRIHVRVEHVKKSKCREDFLKRVKANEVKRVAYKKRKAEAIKKLQEKRQAEKKDAKPEEKKKTDDKKKTLHKLPKKSKKIIKKERKEKKKNAIRVSRPKLKRRPAIPRHGRLVKNIVPIETITPLKYELLM